MAFKPLADRLLVKADAPPEKYIGIGGKELATVSDPNAKLPLGTVIRVGHWWYWWLKGRRIMYEKYCGEEVPLYDKKGSIIPNMIVLKMEDVKGWDDGEGDFRLPNV